MIREGEPEVTLKYLAQSPQRKLAINSFTEGTCYDLDWDATVTARTTCEAWRKPAASYGVMVVEERTYNLQSSR
jgi:hypothetical protein